MDNEKSMLDFILEIDALTTKEFCKKYNVPAPRMIHTFGKPDIEKSADQFLQIDAIKCKMFIDHAKKLVRAKSIICPCGVPEDLHATCCGWKNAGVSINRAGIITEPRHPYFGMPFRQFMEEFK